jgi:topoisomerase-4 subunit A
VANCSDIDDVIIFYKDGKYKVVRVADKMFIGKNVLYVNVFKKNDKRTIYNVVYRDGKDGFHYIKRFNITSITRDREYDVTQGTPGSRIIYFTANPNGEAEVIKITLKPNPRIKKIIYEKDFSDINIKGRQSMGNILSKYEVHKIALKQRGGSTLGGRKVWFDHDVLRLNYDERGQYLGEYQSDDLILIVQDNGEFYTTNFDLNNHYDPGIRVIEKFDANKVWSAALYDADQQGYPYLKRFTFEATSKKLNYLGENKDSRLILLTSIVYPRVQIIFGGHDSFREALEIDVEEFIGVKSYKAKGKRITTYAVESINELPPVRFPDESTSAEEDNEGENEEDNNDNNEETMIEDPDHGKSESDIIDEITGQMKLF